jgi:hypothetical protein
MGACNVLDNAMFDDGSHTYKNFTIGYEDGYFGCEWSYIESKYSTRIQGKIIKAMVEGKCYVVTIDDESRYIEIAWD